MNVIVRWNSLLSWNIVFPELANHQPTIRKPILFLLKTKLPCLCTWVFSVTKSHATLLPSENWTSSPAWALATGISFPLHLYGYQELPHPPLPSPPHLPQHTQQCCATIKRGRHCQSVFLLFKCSSYNSVYFDNTRFLNQSTRLLWGEWIFPNIFGNKTCLCNCSSNNVDWGTLWH